MRKKIGSWGEHDDRGKQLTLHHTGNQPTIQYWDYYQEVFGLILEM